MLCFNIFEIALNYVKLKQSKCIAPKVDWNVLGRIGIGGQVSKPYPRHSSNFVILDKSSFHVSVPHFPLSYETARVLDEMVSQVSFSSNSSME